MESIVDGVCPGRYYQNAARGPVPLPPMRPARQVINPDLITTATGDLGSLPELLSEHVPYGGVTTILTALASRLHACRESPSTGLLERSFDAH